MSPLSRLAAHGRQPYRHGEVHGRGAQTLDRGDPGIEFESGVSSVPGPLVPAEAGTQSFGPLLGPWIHAFAGMSEEWSAACYRRTTSDCGSTRLSHFALSSSGLSLSPSG